MSSPGVGIETRVPADRECDQTIGWLALDTTETAILEKPAEEAGGHGHGHGH